MIITAIILSLIIAYKVRQRHQLKKIKWLLGTWEYTLGGEVFYETWKLNKKADYECTECLSCQKISAQIIYITEKKGTLLLIPMIRKDDGVQPYSFSAELLTDTNVVFVNHELDFPKKIEYTLLNDNEIQIKITGSFLETELVETLLFTRKKDDSCRKKQRKS